MSRRMTFMLATAAGLATLCSAQDVELAAGSAEEDLAIVAEILRGIGADTIVPSSVAKVARGRVVSLDLSNRVPGTSGLREIPDKVFKLTELEELYLNKNEITTLPFELTQLRRLRVLDLGDNEITELPTWIGDLENLERLDLRNNEFSSLPSGIYKLKKLKFLQLWGNDLREIDEDIGKLSSLEELYLERNRLKTLPVALTKMKSLRYIDYGYNYLCNLPPAVHEWLVKRDKKYRSLQKCW